MLGGGGGRGGSSGQLALEEAAEGLRMKRRGETAHAQRLRRLREPQRQKYWGDGAKMALFDMYKVRPRHCNWHPHFMSLARHCN